MRRQEKRSTRPVVEELEPRILHSADAAVLYPPAALVQLAEVRLVDAGYTAMHSAADATPAAVAVVSAHREIAIVDSAVPDHHDLVDDIRATSRGTVDVYILDGTRNGLDQVSRILASQHDIRAIHIISHGSEGAIQLGSGLLDLHALQRNAAAIAGLGAALSEDADILVYGCDVAAGSVGRAFVDAFSRITGADVAASEDLTGAQSRGGNWTFEYHRGSIEAQSAFSAAAEAAWAGTLANTAPVLIGANNLATIDEDPSGDPGTLVSDIIAGMVTDIDAGDPQGIAVTGVVNTNGAWEFSLNSGGSWTAFGSPSQASAQLLAADATTFVRFVPDANWNGSIANGLTFRAWDQSDLAASGTTADVTTNGGASAFSSTEASASITVTPVNDAPTATNRNAAQTYVEDTPLALTPIVVSDIDSTDVTVTLTLSNPGAGSLNTGTSGAVTATYVAGTGVWTASGALADVNALLGSLVFTPTLDFNSDFAIATSVSDGVAAAVTGSKAMTGTAVNDAPALDTARTPVLDAPLEDSGAPVGAVGTLVSALVDFSLPAGQVDNVTDPDTDAQPGIAVIAADTTRGSWWYSTNNGGAWSALGAVSGNSARLLAADSGTRLYFQPTANYSGTLTDAIVFRAWDQSVGSTGGTADTSTNGGSTAFSAAFDGADLTITGVNDAPVRTAGTPAAINVNEDAGNTTAVTLGLGGLAYGPGGGADESAQALTYKITAFPAFITLWLADGTTSVAADTVVSLAQLQGLKYKTVADADGSGSLTWTVQDNGGTSNGGADTLTENLAITVAAINDAPVLSGAENSAGINQNELNSGGTRVSDLLPGHVTDVDAAALSGIAVTSIDNTHGAWQYSINGGGAWTAFGSPGTATARLLAADASTYVRFVPNANWVGTVAGGLTFRAWDQTSGLAGGTADVSSSGGTTAFSTASASASITVHAYPIVFSGTYLENFSALGASGTQMAAGYRAMMIAGSGATYDASNPITAAAIASATATNQTLLVWNPGDSPVHSETQLANAGSIGNASDRALLSGSNNNGATVIELAMRNTTGSPLATISFSYNMKVLADSGATPATEAGALPGYSFFYSLTGGTTAAEWVAVPSLATASTVVGTVTSVSSTLDFATPLAHNATMYFRWADDNFPSVDQDFAIDNVAVQRVNNAPALAGIEGAATAYVENAAATPVTATLTVADADNVNLTGATVTISANYASGQDVLGFANQNGITGSFSAVSGVLTLSGSATLANYQTALRSVTYLNGSDAPSTLTRTVSFSVGDGTDASNTVTRDITVTAVNDAPVLVGTNDASSVNRNPTSNPGTLVADLLAGHVTDVDADALQGIAVTAADNTSGAWQYSTDGGSAWAAFGSPNAATARLLAADALTFVRFVPNANFSGTVANGLTFRAWDQASGAAGATADTAVNGGTSAFSAASSSASIIVTAANTAPVLSGSNDLATINEDPAANGGTLVSAMIAGMTSDADPGALTGIAVTAVDNTNGAWQYSLNGGALWMGFGTATATSARLLAADAATQVRFVPNADWNGTVTNGITFRGWDRSSGVAGATADTTGVPGTFRDSFQTASYANNDGTLAWAGTWVEDDSEGGGAASGRFRISGGTLAIQAGNVGDSIYREVDMTGATSATLSFTYASGLKNSAVLHVQISSDGGAMYTTLPGGVFDASTNTLAGSRSYDISSSIGPNTRIRWYVVAGEGASDKNSFYVGSLQIADTARNGGATAFSTATASSSITVNAVNDAPVRSAGTVADLTVLEDAPATSLGLGALAYGPGGGGDEAVQTLVYTVTALPAATLGTITLADGITAVAASTSYSLAQLQGMQFKSVANASGGPSTFSWTVIDSGGTAHNGVDTRSESLDISVTAVNDAPLGTSTTVTTLEDTAYTFTAADFGFSDSADTPAHALLNVKMTTVPGAGALALSGIAVGAGQFVSVASINAGNLKFTPGSNANGPGYASFTFQVQDDGGVATGGADLDATPRTMTVNVTPVNDAPLGASTTVTALEDTTYTFTAADFGFADAADMPANALLTVRMTTVPGAGALALSGVAVSIGQFVSVADIAAGNLKYTPAANANGAGYASFTFQVQDDGGVANGGVDRDAAPKTMTIDVTSVNDAPLGTGTTVTTLEDAAYIFSVGDFGFTDRTDAGSAAGANALTAVRITALPGAGALTLSGAAVSAGQFVSAADIVAGALAFAPGANAHGAGYASFTFQVRDDGGVANGGVDLDPTPQTMTVSVIPVNDAPLGTSTTVTTLEDTAYTFTAADFGFSDPADTPANALLSVTVAALPGAGALTLAGVSVSAGQSVAAADIAAGALVYTPLANANGAGYASFTFRVQDDGGVADGGADLDPTPRTMTVNVTPVNDAPAGAARTITMLEDAAYTFGAADFGFSDTRDAASAAGADALAAIRIAALPLAGLLAHDFVPVTSGQLISIVDIDAGRLMFIPAANANGASYASFTFQVRDDGGVANGGVDLDPVARAMTIDVTPVNDAPTGADKAITTIEDTPYIFNTADFGFADAADAPPNVLLNARIVTLSGAGGLTLDGVAVAAGQIVAAVDVAAGRLVFSPAPNAHGAGYASFTFRVQDDGGVADGGVDLDAIARTISVDVTSRNDAPTGADATVVTLEDSIHTFRIADFGFADRDPNAFLAVRIGSVQGAGALTLAGAAVTGGQVVSAASIAAGELKLTPAGNDHGAAYGSFTFQVQDDGGVANAGADLDAIARTMSIDVTSVNDAPAGASRTVATREDIAHTFGVADFGYTDPADAVPNTLLNIKVETVPMAGSLTLSGVAVKAGDVVAAARIAAGDLTFTPAARGTGAGYASFSFRVQDDGGIADGGADTDMTPRTLTVNVTRTRFPEPAPAIEPMIFSSASEPDETVASSPTSTPDARARSTFARASATLTVAPTRAAPAGEGDAQVSVLDRSAARTAGDAVRVAQSSPSARLAGDSSGAIAPALILEPVAEVPPRPLIIQAFGSGSRAPTTTSAAEGSNETEDGVQLSRLVTLENGVRASAIMLSAGVVTWTLQGAGLIGSLLTSAPAWRQLDPMPVLAPEEEKPDWGDDDGDTQREEDAADSLWRSDGPRPSRPA